MDFSDTKEEAAFRAEAAAWLEKNVPAFGRRSKGEILKISAGQKLEEARIWQKIKAEGEFAAITWPKEFGGRGGTPMQQVIYGQEESRYTLPRGIYEIGLGICLPAVLHHGTPEQHARHIRPALYGEEIWCQLFSEPAAGSDLAGVRTRAIKDGDDWIVSGQKVWSSGAHYCDFGLLLTRTDMDVPKHKGLTMFIVDMKSPGVEVRPIKQLTGESDFNEVFLSDVRISGNQMVGTLNQGWQVAITALMHERMSVGGDLGFLGYQDILKLAQATEVNGRPAIEDGRVQERICDWYINARGIQLNNFRAITALSKGGAPGPEFSVGKLVTAQQSQLMAYLATDLMNEEGVLTNEELGDDWRLVERTWAWGAAMRIAGGSDEILRNIIAERVLGLPGEIRVDKDVTFAELQKKERS